MELQQFVKAKMPVAPTFTPIVIREDDPFAKRYRLKCKDLTTGFYLTLTIFAYGLEDARKSAKNVLNVERAGTNLMGSEKRMMFALLKGPLP